MVKKQQSRVQKLEFLLKQMDKIHLRDAAEMLDVSEMTLRRDLSNDGSNVVLLGGYIVMNPQKKRQQLSNLRSANTPCHGKNAGRQASSLVGKRRRRGIFRLRLHYPFYYFADRSVHKIHRTLL